MKKGMVFVLLFLCLGFAAKASALSFPVPLGNAVAYGDFYSYSLPLLAWEYDQLYGGGTGPGNPYYVDASDGQIKNLTVLGTGGNGQPVTNNYTGADNAYPLPTGTGAGDYDNPDTYFSTKDTDTYAGSLVQPTPGSVNIGVADPGGAGEFLGDSEDSWDVRLSALSSFLGTDAQGNVNDMFIFFRNNQTNSGSSADQNLYGWALFTLVDTDNSGPGGTTLNPLYFEFLNAIPSQTFPFTPGNDVTQYSVNPALIDTHANSWDSRTNPGNYVLSGGPVTLCLDGSGTIIGVIPISDPTSCPVGTASTVLLNHNLGDNQAAYAVYSPELQAWLDMPNFGGYDALQVYYRFADLNNGDEALWIQAGQVGALQPIPEPATLLLLGSGLIGLAAVGRRKFAARKK
jgi:hypothetical protein